MKTNFTAFYSGLSCDSTKQGKLFTVYLKDAISEDKQLFYFSPTFLSYPKSMRSLKLKKGDLFSFGAEPDERGQEAFLLRPVKFQLQPFELDFRDVFSHFYKNFDEATSNQEEFFGRRLFRQFPDERFWKEYDLGFLLNSLGFFLAKQRMAEVELVYTRFSRAKTYEIPQPTQYELQPEKQGEDLNLDYRKIHKPLLQRF